MASVSNAMTPFSHSASQTVLNSALLSVTASSVSSSQPVLAPPVSATPPVLAQQPSTSQPMLAPPQSASQPLMASPLAASQSAATSSTQQPVMAPPLAVTHTLLGTLPSASQPELSTAASSTAPVGATQVATPGASIAVAPPGASITSRSSPSEELGRLVTAPQPVRLKANLPISATRAHSVAVLPTLAMSQSSQVQVMTTLQEPLSSRFADSDNAKDIPENAYTGPSLLPVKSLQSLKTMNARHGVGNSPTRNYSRAYASDTKLPMQFSASSSQLPKATILPPTIVTTTALAGVGGTAPSSATLPIGPATTTGPLGSDESALYDPVVATTTSVKRLQSPVRETRVMRLSSPVRALSPVPQTAYRTTSPLRAVSPIRALSPRQDRMTSAFYDSTRSPRPTRRTSSDAPTQVLTSPRGRAISAVAPPATSGSAVSPLVLTRPLSPVGRDRSPSPGSSRRNFYTQSPSLVPPLSVPAPSGVSLSSQARAMRMLSTGTDLVAPNSGSLSCTVPLQGGSPRRTKAQVDLLDKSIGFSVAPGFAIPGLPGLRDMSGGFDQPPPPRSAPANVEMQVPPRGAPGFRDDFAAALFGSANGNALAPDDGTFYSETMGESFYADGSVKGQQYGKSLAPLPGEGGDRHILSIMTSDNNWDSIAFTNGASLESLAMQWINKRGLNPAFKRGLISQMRHMVKMNLITASVDIVDLL